MISETQKKKHHLRVELIAQMTSFATSAFGLVAALAWNNVIQQFVNEYVKKFFPAGSDIISLLFYAILVTCIAVFVTYQLSLIKDSVEKRILP